MVKYVFSSILLPLKKGKATIFISEYVYEDNSVQVELSFKFWKNRDLWHLQEKLSS